MSIFNNNLKTIYPDIMRVALKLSRYDRENAEDLVQKALLKAKSLLIFQMKNLALKIRKSLKRAMENLES